jgi:hypothetical protein
VPLSVLDYLTAADELNRICIDLADYPYSDDDMTDVLIESDKEQLDSSSTLSDEEIVK